MTRPHKHTPLSGLPHGVLRAIVRAVLLYAVFAVLWIMLSDRALGLLLHDPSSLVIASLLKGTFFVAFTSLLLFFLLLHFAVRRPADDGAAEASRFAPADRDGRGMFYAIAGLFALVFASLGGAGVLYTGDTHRAAAEKQLQSIAQLKVGQLEIWLNERFSDAQLVRTSPLFSETLSRWRRSGAPADRERLVARLEDVRGAYRYRDVLVCDAQGEVLLQAITPAHAPGDELQDTVRRALASGKTLMTDLFRMEHPSPEHAHLDFVAPLKPVAGQDIEAAAIVLRADVDASLYAVLQHWPVPSDSAEIVLFRREAGGVRYLNELRHQSGTALKLILPFTNKPLLATQALAPGYRAGALLEGIDYRGVPVVGVAQPVAGTSWWVIAKIDRVEIFSAARKEMMWIVYASLLTWVISVALAMLLIERRELRHVQQKRYEQAEKLRVLSLLSAIADGSEDAIFAKDPQGRYTLFNRAAERLAGQPADRIIGQDDSALLPAAQVAVARANDQRVMEEDRVLTSEETRETPEGTRVLLVVKGPLHDGDGRVIGMYGISRDITGRKANEETLRHSNEELQRFNRAMVGRELEMIELKREVNDLAAALGRPLPYDLSAIDASLLGETGERQT